MPCSAENPAELGHFMQEYDFASNADVQLFSYEPELHGEPSGGPQMAPDMNTTARADQTSAFNFMQLSSRRQAYKKRKRCFSNEGRVYLGAQELSIDPPNSFNESEARNAPCVGLQLDEMYAPAAPREVADGASTGGSDGSKINGSLRVEARGDS